MARKNVLYQFKMFDAESLSASATSEPTNVANVDYCSIHVEWTGTSPLGTMTVEVRNGDKDTWYALDFGATIAISGNTGDHQIVLTQMGFTDVRLQYARSSGVGSITATITTKQAGG